MYSKMCCPIEAHGFSFSFPALLSQKMTCSSLSKTKDRCSISFSSHHIAPELIHVLPFDFIISSLDPASFSYHEFDIQSGFVKVTWCIRRFVMSRVP